MKDKILNFLKKIKEIKLKKIKLSNPSKFSAFVIFTVILLYIVCNLFVMGFNYFIGHRVVVHKEIENNSSILGDVAIIKNRILILNSEGLINYDFEGEENFKLLYDIYSPYLEVNGSKIAMADTDGTNACVAEKTNIKYNIKTDEKIHKIYVNKKGSSAVITDETGYKSLIKVYDENGKEIFDWHIGDGYAVDVKLTDDGKNLIVLSVNVNEDTVVTNVSNINIKKGEVKSECKFENTLGFSVICKGKSIILVSDSCISTINAGGKVKNKYTFSGCTIQAYNYDEEGNIYLSLTADDSKSYAIMLNSRLKEKMKCEIPVQGISIDGNKKKIAVIGDNSIYVIKGSHIYAKGLLAKEADSINVSRDGKRIAASKGSHVIIYKTRVGK